MTEAPELKVAADLAYYEAILVEARRRANLREEAATPRTQTQDDGQDDDS